MTHAFHAQSDIFQLYEIENTVINGKAHYTSDDGTRGVWFPECGLWIVGHPNDR